MFSILAQHGGRFAFTSHGNLSESHKQHADTPKQGLHSPQMFLNLDESQSNWHGLKRACRPFGSLRPRAEGIIRELVGIRGLSNPNLHIDSTIISLVFKSDYTLQLEEGIGLGLLWEPTLRQSPAQRRHEPMQGRARTGRAVWMSLSEKKARFAELSSPDLSPLHTPLRGRKIADP